MGPGPDGPMGPPPGDMGPGPDGPMGPPPEGYGDPLFGDSGQQVDHLHQMEDLLQEIPMMDGPMGPW